jgi:exodeoxyribonuclease V alpha subunit
VTHLVGFVGAFSARAAQIKRSVQRYEADWRTTHPGQEPGPGLRRGWDARVWADERRTKSSRPMARP